MLRAERIKELVEKNPELKDPLEVILNLRRKATKQIEKIIREIKKLIKDKDYKTLEELIEETEYI